MISFKDNIIVDNSENAKFLRISTKPKIDLSINTISVRIFRLDSPYISNTIIEDLFSTKIIDQSNQANNFSFDIPITQGKFSVDIKFLSGEELVDSFIITLV